MDRSNPSTVEIAMQAKMRAHLLVASVLLVVLALQATPAEADIYSEMATCACHLLYRPVCASNNESYSNDCVLNCAMNTPTGRSIKLHKVKDGNCNEEF
uniref:Kazal-like domain-containing protein n=1 Tax=Anopheles dirus TaxID=7168 RepID=A0A182NE55_9DIPT